MYGTISSPLASLAPRCQGRSISWPLYWEELLIFDNFLTSCICSCNLQSWHNKFSSSIWPDSGGQGDTNLSKPRGQNKTVSSADVPPPTYTYDKHTIISIHQHRITSYKFPMSRKVRGTWYILNWPSSLIPAHFRQCPSETVTEKKIMIPTHLYEEGYAQTFLQRGV
jgi:hypothetical protein